MAQRTVAGFLDAQDPDRRAVVEALRVLVVEVEPRVVESIKWNAPSWTLDGEDRLTLNVADRRGRVRLVLHMGVARPERKGAPPVLDDPAGLVAWSSDIRGVLTVTDLAGLAAGRPAIADVIRRWLAIPVRPALAPERR